MQYVINGLINLISISFRGAETLHLKSITFIGQL